ncbi:unnamed protein product [Allacma fusca]|uniref:Uncharacterized protein n=1 Tax=Allacma fusca TaxID=39272 RepID=A0A8J2JP67_9HEXA|nr:unnamed protein product [Allacma fusca]
MRRNSKEVIGLRQSPYKGTEFSYSISDIYGAFVDGVFQLRSFPLDGGGLPLNCFSYEHAMDQLVFWKNTNSYGTFTFHILPSLGTFF